MVVQENFFDLYDFFVNELIGSPQLAVILGAGIIIYLGLKFKIRLEPISLLVGIFFLMMFSNTALIIIYTSIVLVVGLLFYFGIDKKLHR